MVQKCPGLRADGTPYTAIIRRRCGEVPLGANHLTMFIDVHDRLLYYAVCAWEETFTGYVIDYGTFPEQRRSTFTLADATQTLGRAFPGAGVAGAIHAGLEHLVSAYLVKDWSRGGGQGLLGLVEGLPYGGGEALRAVVGLFRQFRRGLL